MHICIEMSESQSLSTQFPGCSWSWSFFWVVSEEMEIVSVGGSELRTDAMASVSVPVVYNVVFQIIIIQTIL